MAVDLASNSLGPAVGIAVELEAAALARLVAAPRSELADRAHTALQPLLPHDALVLVTPQRLDASALVAPAVLSTRLAEVEWWRPWLPLVQLGLLGLIALLMFVNLLLTWHLAARR